VSPRPRKVSDEEVVDAAVRAMGRLAPSQLTLAEIAAEAGVTAGALVQRFGSKRELLLAVAARASEGTPALLARLRAEHASPLAALHAYARCFAEMGASPAAVARSLAYLQVDLTDPAFHQLVMVQAHATRAALRDLVAAAVAAGELAPATDAEGLARLVEAALSGSLLGWAFYQSGSAQDWLARDLDALLALAREASPVTAGGTSRGGDSRAAPTPR
jgi:AcrR family transcriptional regulator